MKQDLKVLAEHIEKKVGKAHVFHKIGQVGAACRIPELG